MLEKAWERWEERKKGVDVILMTDFCVWESVKTDFYKMKVC